MAFLEQVQSIGQTAAMTEPQKLGLVAFDELRAEAEPWLTQVFEAPPEFELFQSTRSYLVFGEPGAGKSSLCRALMEIASSAGNSQRLVVPWQPHVGREETVFDSAFVDRQLNDIFDSCAFSLLTYLLSSPERFPQALPWAQATLHWFIHLYLRNAVEVRSGPLQRTLTPTGKQVLQQLAASPVHAIFERSAQPEQVMGQLVNALAEVGLQGVWVMVDQAESWHEADTQRLANGLRAFFSSLNLFEQNGFAYRIFLPMSLRPYLTGVSGIERRRLTLYYLHWTAEKLSDLLVRRLAFATSLPLQQLDQICSDPSLPTWLERCGGLNPRGWLNQFRPLAAAYLERLRTGQPAAISVEEWRAIRRRHPPLLTFNREEKRVQVEARAIDLTDEQFKIFEYLYDHAGKICTRSELYYLAYRGLTHELTVSDKEYEAPESYRTLIETAIWRLRRSIEPDDAEETFIITIKGKGYRLEHT